MRNTKKLPWILLLICLSGFASSAFAGEADIHIPDLENVKFAGLGGMTGHTLMMLGIVVCAIGAIFGALAFRTIGDLLFVFDIEPLWQPLFQGTVLLLAVCLGAARLFQIRNRLDLFG